MKGVPLRIEVGTRDIEKNQVVVVRRDNNEKLSILFNEINKKVPELLKAIQENLYVQAKLFRDQNTHKVKSYNEFNKIIKSGGFVRCGWDGLSDTESNIKNDTKATIRCIPFDENIKGLKCILSGKPAKHEVIYAKAY